MKTLLFSNTYQGEDTIEEAYEKAALYTCANDEHLNLVLKALTIERMEQTKVDENIIDSYRALALDHTIIGRTEEFIINHGLDIVFQIPNTYPGEDVQPQESKTKPLIIAITGQARHGKDTAADYLVEHHGFTRLSIATPVKEMLYRLNPQIFIDTYMYELLQPYMDQSTGSLPPTLPYASLVDLMGLDTLKAHPVIRTLLQRLGTDAAREVLGEDIWVETFDRTIKASDAQRIVISDIRFPNEAAWATENAAGFWRVMRPNFENGVDTSHPSEKFITTLEGADLILNDGSIKKFYDTIEDQLQLTLKQKSA